MKPALRVALSLAGLLAPLGAHAFCPSFFAPTSGSFYNNAAFINPVEAHLVFSMSRPYWMVLAAQATPAGSSDYDVAMYQNSSGGPEPVCMSGLLAVSARTTTTDFVVGDFNHNPYANYYARVNCYSGTCASVNTQWRNGGTVLTVNGGPLTVEASSSVTPRQMVHVYDVFLNAGTRYYFNFQATGDLQHKMLLFRNPTGGVFWGSRNDAVFETAGCTTYDAPSNGYYGLVVVADAPPNFLDGAFTIGVTTQPVCSCPAPLASGVPVTTAPGPALDHRLAVQPDRFWSVVGLRSSSDWDLVASTLNRAHPNVNCGGTLLAQSAQNTDPIEMVVSDANDPQIAVPDTMHITAATFVGNTAATLQFDAGQDFGQPAGWKFPWSLSATDIVRIWDLYLTQGVAYRMSLRSFGPSVRALLFRNPTGGRYIAGRDLAVFTVSDTATYVAPSTGYYGLVMVHDDAVTGGAILEGGPCFVSAPLTDGDAVAVTTNLFTSFTPARRNWGVAAVVGETDFDVALFGSPSGPGYPDCFADPGASSNNSGNLADFVVGDFHDAAPQTVRARFFEFTPLGYAAARAQWAEAQVPVAVNGPAVTDNLLPGHFAAIHEVFLRAGNTYTLQFVPAPDGAQRVFLFGNPGGGAVWYPRSSALVSTTSTVSFTAPWSGSYALVVMSEELANWGTTSLSVTGPVADATPVTRPLRTRIAAAGPNPSRGPLDLRLELAAPGEVSLDLLDVSGRAVSRLDLGRRDAGAGEARWDVRAGAAAIPPGLYFVRFVVDGRPVETRRVTLAR